MKNNKKRRNIKFILFFIITISIYIKTLTLLENLNIDIKNNKIYELLIESSTSIDNKNIKEILSPNNLITNNIVYNDEIVNTNSETIIKEEEKELEDEQEKDPTPIVYIYNTHQTETYSTEYLTEYTITPNIMIASYMLKENLEEYDIYSYVEEDSIKEILNKNNWKYNKSYKVSRSFIEKRKKEIPSLKIFIDLHRDSVKRKHTTIEINKETYAKVMILVGMDHDSYKNNLKEAEKINNKINKYYPGLSRGIYKKSGKGVNGIYNQDYSKYVFLFEIGGIENNINEVNNTINALSKVLSEYIKEEGF